MTPEQAAVLAVIRDRITRTGVAPTVREIMGVTGQRSPSGVQRKIDALVRSGQLARAEPGRSRGITLPGVALDAVPTERLREEIARREQDRG